MPPLEPSRAEKFRELVQKDRTAEFETLWLEHIDRHPEDVATFFAGADALLARGNSGRASLFLSMVVRPLLDKKSYDPALRVLRRLVDMSSKDRDIREQIIQVYRGLRGAHPHFDTYLARSGLSENADLKLAVTQFDTFLGFEVGRYVFHRSGWGCGRIVEVDPDQASVVIDFETKPGHAIPMEMAAKVTEFVAANDLRALRFDRKDELARLLEEDPVEVIRATLRMRKGPVCLRDVRNRITDGIVDAKQWSRWWQKARNRIKQITDITMGPGSNPTLELKEIPGGLAESYLRDLRLVADDKKRVKYFRDLLKEGETEGGDKEQALTVIGRALLGPSGDAKDMELGPRISLALLLQEVRRRYPSVDLPGGLEAQNLLGDVRAVLRALPEVPVGAHRVTVLRLLQEAVPEWPSIFLNVILHGEVETADAALEGLVAHGHVDEAKRTLQTIIERYREYPEAFAWYAKACLSRTFPRQMPKIGRPTLLEKTLILHNYLEAPGTDDSATSDRRRQARTVLNVILSRDYALVKGAFEDADMTAGQNLVSLLRRNRSLNGEVRDKVMAVMYRTRPEFARSLDAGRAGAEPGGSSAVRGDAIYVTAASLLRRRKEYEILVNQRIPENAAEIGRAASYGDLSENAEWSAAIEKQGHLTTLSQEWGEELAKVRPIDPTLVASNTVSIGSRVRVRAVDGTERTYTVLGPWDVDMDRNFVSYESPLGGALLERSVGDVAEVEVPSGIARYELLSVENGLADAEAILAQRPPDV